ncbi:hypothetical protein [Moraxella sp. ZY200743]|uniref:hypothetical protein n=1 Tax=Moraxella sp. ZY200743 TaxID=2911970 RepID=UPI003D7DEDE3
MNSKKHATKQYMAALQAENKEWHKCHAQNVAENERLQSVIADLTAQRDILAKENGELRYIATILKNIHAVIMDKDNAKIAQFVNTYRQIELERRNDQSTIH